MTDNYSVSWFVLNLIKNSYTLHSDQEFLKSPDSFRILVQVSGTKIIQKLKTLPESFTSQINTFKFRFSDFA